MLRVLFIGGLMLGVLAKGFEGTLPTPTVNGIIGACILAVVASLIVRMFQGRQS
jgi:hypothetical protein